MVSPYGKLTMDTTVSTSATHAERVCWNAPAPLYQKCPIVADTDRPSDPTADRRPRCSHWICRTTTHQRTQQPSHNNQSYIDPKPL